MSDRIDINCVDCAHYSGPIGKRCGRRGSIPGTKKEPGDTCEFSRISARLAPPDVLARGFDAITAWQDLWTVPAEPAKAPAQAPQPTADSSGQTSFLD